MSSGFLVAACGRGEGRTEGRGAGSGGLYRTWTTGRAARLASSQNPVSASQPIQ